MRTVSLDHPFIRHTGILVLKKIGLFWHFILINHLWSNRLSLSMYLYSGRVGIRQHYYCSQGMSLHLIYVGLSIRLTSSSQVLRWGICISFERFFYSINICLLTESVLFESHHIGILRTKTRFSEIYLTNTFFWFHWFTPLNKMSKQKMFGQFSSPFR